MRSLIGGEKMVSIVELNTEAIFCKITEDTKYSIMSQETLNLIVSQSSTLLSLKGLERPSLYSFDIAICSNVPFGMVDVR